MSGPRGAAYEDLLAAVACGHSADEARKLVADLAHELAEQIREHNYDPGEVGPVHLAYQDAADLIDPEVARPSSTTREEGETVSAYVLDVPELYRRLDERRRERGLTWRQLADVVRVSPSTFSRMTDGRKPDADALVTLLVWLDLDTDVAYFIKPKEAS